VLLNCQSAGQLRLTLTDHNLLGQDFACLTPSVVGIVDHHVDQTDPLHATLSQERDIVVPLGSATTLVAERYLGFTPLPSLGAAEFDPSSLLDAAVGNLIIGTILIDTANLDPKMGRTEPRDVRAVETIVNSLKAGGDQFGLNTLEERTELFQYLQDIKFDLSRLTSAELLRKDYKVWQAVPGGQRYGISSVTMSLAEWTEKDKDLAETLANYMNEQKLAILVIMTSHTGGENKTFRREAAVIAAPGFEPLLTHTIVAITQPLTLKAMEYPSALHPTQRDIRFFTQTDVKLSRKQFQPAIHTAIQGFTATSSSTRL